MDELIFLLRSKLKRAILEALQEQALTPLMLSKLLKRPLASISRSMLELNEVKFVHCLNPKDDRWRKYEVTSLGKKVLKEARRFN